MSTLTMPKLSLIARLERFWRERVVGLLVAQLKQGITPHKIALTITLGVCLSAFPILGTTSLLCLVFGIWLGLNQPVIQLVNWLGSPLQMGLFAPFVRLGEHLTRSPRVSFSIPELITKFRVSPLAFFREFGLTGWHGIVGWLVVAPLAGVLLYFIFLPLTQKLAEGRNKTEATL
jgi:uncharacterized protein (DUF2062 family)